jgi:hypothetical protein
VGGDPVNGVDPSGMAWFEDAYTWLDVNGVDDALVGWGDTVSFGAGAFLREHATDLDDVVDHCTGYNVGVGLGVATHIAIGGWGTHSLGPKDLSGARWIKANLFRWERGPFKLGRSVADRWHFHLGPGKALMENHHLPYQARAWFHHARALSRRWWRR